MINKKKKILLTCHSLVNFAGSEINTLTLAKALTKRDFEVEIGTFQFDMPIKNLFEEENLIVTNLLIEDLKSGEYDLVWSHHAITLNQIIFKSKIKTKKIIFSSLSPFEPLEYPPLYINSLSMCLANSNETIDQLIIEGVDKDRLILFPNYAPLNFLNKGLKVNNREIKNIVIISNHLPKEIKQLTEKLELAGINVKIYGLGYEQVNITENILLNYDAVITIGKTVQYSLALGIPTYCYDIHGGPGWINEENFEKAAYFNFSGRGFHKKLEPEELFNEVVKGYQETLHDTTFLQLECQKRFSLEKNLTDLLDRVDNIDSHIDLEEIRVKFKSLERENAALLREYEYNNYRKKLSEEYQKGFIKVFNYLGTTVNNERLLDPIFVKEEINHVLDILKNRDGYNKKLLNLVKQKEKEHSNLLELIDQKIIKNQSLLEQIEQKEKNNKYLLELNEEINNRLTDITNTKVWVAAEKMRRLNIKIKKGVKNPKLIFKKLSRSTNKYKVLNIESNKNTTNNSNDNLLDKPLVSVVIPIYDREDVLRESINSILNQSYPNIEVLLVSDGSPENTLKIIDEYSNHPQVKIFKFKNNSGNAVRGRNKAIKEANGKYLAFQDSDDIAELDRIEVSVAYAEKYKADIVYGGWRALVEGTREIELENKQEIFSPDCDYEFLKEICVPCQSTVMVDLEAVRKVGGLKPQMRYREDHELWLRLAYNGYKFKSIPKILTNLRLHEGNLELSFKDNDNKWEILALEEHKHLGKLKPKIGYVIAGTGISGGLAVICQHANHLLSKGYDVTLYTEDGKNSIDWFPNQLVNVEPIEKVPSNLDILIATYWKTAYTIENIPAKNKLYFIQSDESKFFEKNSVEYKAAINTYKMDYEFITMAKWIKDWLEKDFGKKATYIPNGLDLNVMKPTTPLIPKNEKVRVLLEGPIDVPFKGMKEAFEIVKELDCEVMCISTAGRPEVDWKCDYFFENVPMNQMSSLYSSCDILLKMSKVESFSLPALEMMACGNTCVLNKFNGVDEFAEHGYNALVVELGDIEGAKVALKQLIGDSKLREMLSQNGLETAQQWEWNRSIEILEDYINNQLKW